MNFLLEEPFDFKCAECGKNFEVSISETEREFGCPKCSTGWKIHLKRGFVKVYRKKQ
jgi:DNA-directed RNA polymerase subunit RPC12/RpoP